MSYPQHDLVGASTAMRHVGEFIGRAARFNANVLIEGESGTGKELVARAIHRNSARASGPFIAINCSALPEAVLENELFGHEAEAFTGARTRTKGKFEAAHGGTLFLDEIGEMSWTTQAKLLRVVEYREFHKVGGSGTAVRVDIRLVAATNRDLVAAVKSKEFRQDLYYRLCVMPLNLLPLREHLEDVPLLVRHFIAGLGTVTGISSDAEAILCRYHWPGNVRQLKHVLECAAAFASGPVIGVEDLVPAVFESPSADDPVQNEKLDEVMLRLKRQFVDTVMRSVRGDLKRAAEALGKHPAGMSRLLDGLDLSHWKRNHRGLIRSSNFGAQPGAE